jgi:secreted trypsin-like serine protease
MYRVYLGMSNISDIESNTHQGYSVASIIVNEHYDHLNKLNDIALLKLNSDVELGKTIQLACLPPLGQADYPKERNMPAMVAGWGSMIEGVFKRFIS